MGGGSPGCIDDDDIPLLANFQRSVCVRLPQRVSCIDGGSGQGLGHGHSHVHTGQVHDHRLRQEEKALEEQPLQVRMLLHTAQAKTIKCVSGIAQIEFVLSIQKAQVCFYSPSPKKYVCMCIYTNI